MFTAVGKKEQIVPNTINFLWRVTDILTHAFNSLFLGSDDLGLVKTFFVACQFSNRGHWESYKKED